MEIPETHSDRTYLPVTLPNGLRCCLISDPTIEKAAVAVTVAAGQLQDSLPGIAHLTEHLLFMGSKKYDSENEYDQFVQQHGGHSNAYTDNEATCFYLDVVTAQFEGAMDRLACALSEPLLAVSSIERELLAVDSEHAKNVSNDMWRQMQLIGTILGQDGKHAMANFGTGNKESLLKEAGSESPYERLRTEVERFYHEHYVSSNMTLAAMSNCPVEELQTLVEKLFSKLPSGPSKTVYSPPLPEFPPTVVEWVPLRQDCALLDVQWVLPESQWSKYRTKPTRFWSHIIGHEGPGTLLSVLREKQWAQDLTADDVSYTYRNIGIFALSIELTGDGFDHVNEVLQMVFYYVEKVMETIPAWVYDELRVSGESAFRFLGKYPSSDTCSSLSSSMHMYEDPKFYLSGTFKYFEYDPTEVEKIGKALRSRSSNIMIMLGSSSFESTADQTDYWYGTKYRCIRNDHPILQMKVIESNDTLTTSLVMPDRNDMLPEKFELLADREDCDNLEEASIWKNAPEAPPRCLLNEGPMILWYKADYIFKTPKVSVTALLRSPLFTGGPRIAVMAAFWVEVASELCNDFSYNASMAGLHCQFQDSVRGVQISVGGYNDKASILLKLICEKISHFSVETAFFERIRKKLAQSIQSSLVSPPYSHGSMAVNLVLESVNKGNLKEQLDFLMNDRLLGVEELTSFSKALLSQSRIEMFVHGNVTAGEAKTLSKILTESFQPENLEPLVDLRAVEMPQSSMFRLEGWNQFDENSCIVLNYQVGTVSLRVNAVLSLLAQLIREPAFNILRTEEQLGYIVFSMVKTSADNVKNLMFLIQSDGYSPEHVDDRIEAFLVMFRDKVLVEMTEGDFQDNVNSLCEGLLEKPKNLAEESHKHWDFIVNRSYHFSRLQDIAALVRTLTLNDIMQFFDRHILATSPFRRKLSIHMYGKAHIEHLPAMNSSKNAGNAVEIITCPKHFGRSRSLLPTQAAASLEPHMFQLFEL